MIFLREWARRHGVSDAALYDLKMLMTAQGDGSFKLKKSSGDSEAAVSNDVRLEGGHKGVRLFRNNVGACEDKTGRIIRYGLANESKEMNKELKSSDLIGIRPLLITDNMVGCTIGQFVAREAKPRNWAYCGNDHERAQLNFLNFVIALGGDACFANDTGTL